MRSGESNDSEIIFIGSSKCHLCHLESSYTSPGFKLSSIGPIQCTPGYLEPSCALWALKPVLVAYFRKTKKSIFH